MWVQVLIYWEYQFTQFLFQASTYRYSLLYSTNVCQPLLCFRNCSRHTVNKVNKDSLITEPDIPEADKRQTLLLRVP